MYILPRRLCIKNLISEIVTPPSKKTLIGLPFPSVIEIVLARLDYIQIKNKHEDVMKPDMKTSLNPLCAPFRGNHF